MDKDVNEEKQKAVVSEVGAFRIAMYSDGNINVSGPIKNPVVVLDVFGRALAAVAEYVTKNVTTFPGAVPPNKLKVVTLN